MHVKFFYIFAYSGKKSKTIKQEAFSGFLLVYD